MSKAASPFGPRAIPVRFGYRRLRLRCLSRAAAAAVAAETLDPGERAGELTGEQQMEYGAATRGALLAAAPLSGARRSWLPLSSPPSPPSIQVRA